MCPWRGVTRRQSRVLPLPAPEAGAGGPHLPPTSRPGFHRRPCDVTGAEGCRPETDKEDAPAPAPPCSRPPGVAADPGPAPSCGSPAPSSLSGPLMVLLRVPCFPSTLTDAPHHSGSPHLALSPDLKSGAQPSAPRKQGASIDTGCDCGLELGGVPGAEGRAAARDGCGHRSQLTGTGCS